MSQSHRANSEACMPSLFVLSIINMLVLSKILVFPSRLETFPSTESSRNSIARTLPGGKLHSKYAKFNSQLLLLALAASSNVRCCCLVCVSVTQEYHDATTALHSHLILILLYALRWHPVQTIPNNHWVGLSLRQVLSKNKLN